MPASPLFPSSRIRRIALGLVAISAPLVLTACGSDGPVATATAERAGAETSAAEATGLRTVSAVDGATLAADPPEGLVVLDIRTPAEFASGHLAHATMIDFYQADFADRLAQLDPNAPYLLYCNSGNRSAEALTMMSGLGFTDVTEIDGGIQAWLTNGLAVTIP